MKNKILKNTLKGRFESRQSSVARSIDGAIQSLTQLKKDVCSGQKVSEHTIGNLLNGLASLQSYSELLAALEWVECMEDED